MGTRGILKFLRTWLDQPDLVSPLLWKAFQLSSTCHGCYPFPLKWSHQRKQFFVNKSRWQIRCWTVAVILFIFGVGSILCLYLFVMEAYFGNGSNYISAFLLLIIAILSLVGWQVSLTIVVYRYQLVLFFNSMLEMERKLQTNRIYNNLTLMDHFTGATVLYVVFVFVIFPYTSVPVAVYFRMDPLSHFVKVYFPLFSVNYPVLCTVLTYTVILFVGVTAILIASQTYAFILLYMTTTLLIYRKLLADLSRIVYLEKRLRSYRAYFVLHQIYAGPAAIASGVSLTVGFILSILLALVCLQGFGKFPLVIYLYSMLTEFTILILVFILLPTTFQVYEKSRTLIRVTWKKDLVKVHRGTRTLVKDLRQLRPVYFGFYSILKLTQSWGASYVFNMMDCIMDGCMTFSLS